MTIIERIFSLIPTYSVIQFDVADDKLNKDFGNFFEAMQYAESFEEACIRGEGCVGVVWTSWRNNTPVKAAMVIINELNYYKREQQYYGGGARNRRNLALARRICDSNRIYRRINRGK